MLLFKERGLLLNIYISVTILVISSFHDLKASVVNGKQSHPFQQRLILGCLLKYITLKRVVYFHFVSTTMTHPYKETINKL